MTECLIDIIVDSMEPTFSEASLSPSSSASARPTIHVRRPKFDFDDIDRPFFYRDNPILSAFFVSVSAAFPPGEAAFIRAVKRYEDEIQDPKLRQDIREFTLQEGLHSFHHRQMNKAFERVGYAADSASQRWDEIIEAENASDEDALARTVAMEHITAVMAKVALENPALLAPMPESLRQAFAWHAIEEIEHKSVAFEVYMKVIGDRWRLRRALLHQHRSFFSTARTIQFELLGKLDYQPTMKHRIEALRQFLQPRGIFRALAGESLRFMGQDFHPWDVDESALIGDAEQMLDPAYRAA